MRALIVDPTAPGRLRLGDAPDPVPGPGQVLIEVRHTSLNAAELFFAERAAPGEVIGFDAAGVVVTAAADGTGPAVGSRVVGFAEGGGFGALRAMDVADVAVVPDGVELGEAATLPVAAGTALRALEQAGPLLGRTVLVTGASGGVGGSRCSSRLLAARTSSESPVPRRAPAVSPSSVRTRWRSDSAG